MVEIPPFSGPSAGRSARGDAAGADGMRERLFRNVFRVFCRDHPGPSARGLEELCFAECTLGETLIPQQPGRMGRRRQTAQATFLAAASPDAPTVHRKQ